MNKTKYEELYKKIKEIKEKSLNDFIEYLCENKQVNIEEKDKTLFRLQC